MCVAPFRHSENIKFHPQATSNIRQKMADSAMRLMMGCRACSCSIDFSCISRKK